MDFDAHSEGLEILNLGTDWIEITDSVPVDSPFSRFHAVAENKAISAKYSALRDVSIAYIFQTVGPVRYELRLRSLPLISCFTENVGRLLLGDRGSCDANPFDSDDANPVDLDPVHFASIKAATAYFRTVPPRVTDRELAAAANDDGDDGDDAAQCRLERVLAAGSLFSARSPSTACRFPGNLAADDPRSAASERIVMAARGHCTFYEKIETLSAGHGVKGAVIGNPKGAIFTMGTDGTERSLPLPSLMVDALSFDALESCAATLGAADLRAEMVEILTRCEESERSELTAHGTNAHFSVSSVSNTLFVVHREDDVFKLSLPDAA